MVEPTPEIASPDAVVPVKPKGALPSGESVRENKQGKQISFETIGIIATITAVGFALAVCIPHF